MTFSFFSQPASGSQHQIGDIVWAKAPQLMGWPGVIISHTERKKDKLTKPPPGKVGSVCLVAHTISVSVFLIACTCSLTCTGKH